MADGTATGRGIEFARDLKEIRQANGISIEDIHAESKIPIGLIESFEESGLLDHTMFNRVYLRSFVRTYAEVVGISSDVALASLEAALDGTYDRDLAVEYLGHEPEAPPAREADREKPVPPAEEAGGVTAAAGTRGEAVSAEKNRVPEEGEAIQEEEQIPEEEVVPGAVESLPEEEEPVPEEEEPALPDAEEVVVTPEAPPAPAASMEHTPPAPPPPAVADWTSQSPPPGSPHAAAARNGGGGGSQWLMVALGIVVLGAAIWGVVSITGGPGTGSDGGDVAATDTEAVAEEPPAEEAPPPIVLGDTMHVTIASADNQPVRDIKVRIDDDVRRPYWIEEGESRDFTATEQIIIERELDKINLLIEGRPYPTSRVDDQGRVVITRDTAQQFLSGGQ